MDDSLSTPKRSWSIPQVLGDAWHLVRGNKWPIWAVALVVLIVPMIIQLLALQPLFRLAPSLLIIYQFLLLPLIKYIVVAPFFGGAVMTAILCARHEAVQASTGYRYLNKSWALIVTLFIIALLSNVLSCIVHLPWVMTLHFNTAWLGIPVALIELLVYVFLFISVPLVIDKNKTPWNGLVTSCRIMQHYWFKTFIILILIVFILFTIAMIPLSIGMMMHSPYIKLLGAAITIIALIWLVPFSFLVQGMLYHKIVD